MSEALNGVFPPANIGADRRCAKTLPLRSTFGMPLCFWASSGFVLSEFSKESFGAQCGYFAEQLRTFDEKILMNRERASSGRPLWYGNAVLSP
jgi:hypothetical protein